METGVVGLARNTERSINNIVRYRFGSQNVEGRTATVFDADHILKTAAADFLGACGTTCFFAKREFEGGVGRPRSHRKTPGRLS